MISDCNNDQIQMLASLYVACALSDQERAIVESILNDDTNPAKARELRDAIATFEPAAQVLTERIGSIAPTPSVREQLMHRIQDDALKHSPPPTDSISTEPSHGTDVSESDETAAPVWRSWSSDVAPEPSLFTLPSDAGAWEDTGVDGIQVRRLFVDEPNNRMTAMFRMEPGSSYVPHRHDSAEECYVLEGDLHVGDEVVLHAGDYQRAEAGSLHGVQWTEKGCLLLISCSLHDEQMYTDDDPSTSN